MPRRMLAAAVLLVVALPVVLSACSDDPAPDRPSAVRTGTPVSWTRVDLRTGDEPVVLTKRGTDLLVGVRRRGADVVPGLLVLTGDRATTVPLQPRSPYAFQAVWESIATDGTRILALGGARGGAHSNPRWTVWSGTAAGLVEHPQEFNTFGGQTAGSLFSAVITPAGEALLGSWGGGDQSGLDAAVWLVKGTTWTRQKSAGTALQSTPALLVGPSFGTVSGGRVVLVGSQVRLAPNVVQQSAAVWRSTALNQGWTRLALPDPGERSNALTATCTEARCVVSGQVDGQLAIWQLEGDKAARLRGVPPLAVGDKDRLPPPVMDGDQAIQPISEAGRVKLLSGHGSEWTVQDASGPTGAVSAAAAVGESLYLVAGPVEGPTALWRADLGAVG